MVTCSGNASANRVPVDPAGIHIPEDRRRGPDAFGGVAADSLDLAGARDDERPEHAGALFHQVDGADPPNRNLVCRRS